MLAVGLFLDFCRSHTGVDGDSEHRDVELGFSKALRLNIEIGY